jgi:hypothetical protein
MTLILFVIIMKIIVILLALTLAASSQNLAVSAWKLWTEPTLTADKGVLNCIK